MYWKYTYMYMWIRKLVKCTWIFSVKQNVALQKKRYLQNLLIHHLKKSLRRGTCLVLIGPRLFSCEYFDCPPPWIESDFHSAKPLWMSQSQHRFQCLYLFPFIVKILHCLLCYRRISKCAPFSLILVILSAYSRTLQSIDNFFWRDDNVAIQNPLLLCECYETTGRISIGAGFRENKILQ